MDIYEDSVSFVVKSILKTDVVATCLSQPVLKLDSMVKVNNKIVHTCRNKERKLEVSSEGEMILYSEAV